MIPDTLILTIQAGAILALLGSLPPRRAAWWGWTVSLVLLPTLVVFRLPGGATIEPRWVALGLLAPALYSAWTADGRPRRGWRLTDVIVAALVLEQYLSAVLTGVNPISLVMDPLMGVALPYLMGRLALGSIEETGPFLKVLCLVALVLAGATLLQAATGFNVFSLLGTKNFRGTRIGLTRANGPMKHPLYLAMTLLMLMAPALVAAAWARARRGPAWWRLLPWLLPVAAVGTVSRGPMMAILAAVGLFIILGARAWRIPLLIVWLSGAAVAMNDVSALKQQLNALVESDKAKEREAIGKGGARIVVIDDKEYVYTGIEHRSLTFKVYERPLDRMGPFGYGPRRRGVNIDPSLEKRFSSIDNAYLSYMLTYGRVGIGLLVAMLVAAMIEMARIFGNRRDPRTTAARALFAVLLATMVAMYGVSLNSDHAGLLMFLVGLSTNLAVLRAPAAVPSGRGGAYQPPRGWPGPVAVPAVRP